MEKKKTSLRERIARKYSRDMPYPLQKGKFLFTFFLCVPAVLGFLVWYVGVNAQSIAMAFQDALTGDWSFVNFKRLLNELSSPNTELFVCLLNTLKYFLMGSIILPVTTYFIAYYIYKKIKLSKFFLIMLHLPGILSGVVVASMIKNLISPLGPISTIMNKMGLGLIPGLLGDPETATPTLLVIVFILGLSGNVLLWIGTFKRIPQEVIEAAKMDGANEMQELFRIVTPMVSTTAVTLFILSATGIFTASGPILYYTGGSAETGTLSFWIFSQTYHSSLLNYPAAVGLFFTAIGLPIVMSIHWLANRIAKHVEY